jgi:hypothetical protein
MAILSKILIKKLAKLWYKTTKTTKFAMGTNHLTIGIIACNKMLRRPHGINLLKRQTKYLRLIFYENRFELNEEFNRIINTEYNKSKRCRSFRKVSPVFVEEDNKVIHMRSLFSLPRIIFGIYESQDQFITLQTEDGVKMLHIYHLDKSKPQRQQEIHWRLFCDHKTGWVYSYDNDSQYKKYKFFPLV